MENNYPDHFFIEIGHAQEKKRGQAAFGDVFLSQKVDGGRVISVLADGLGSGIKASVLANLTATMAARYMAEDADIVRAAHTILDTLPVCSQRQIAYSTFTIVDIDRNGWVRIIEYDNPPFVLMRKDRAIQPESEEIRFSSAMGREVLLRETRFQIAAEDRIVICSDGVTQAGTGRRDMPMGLGATGLRAFVERSIQAQPTLSARQLAHSIVRKALSVDALEAKDDITAGVIYLRKPREVLLFTGAPVDRMRDGQLADLARGFQGRKVVCGGTTARILARELNCVLTFPTDALDPKVPPVAEMGGFDLVTEGALTLARLMQLLEQGQNLDEIKPNAATRLAGILLDSDIIHIVAGLKINEAMQDPNLPPELDIRRNIIRRLKNILTTQHLKDVRVSYL